MSRTIDCPICLEEKNSYVTLNCNHKACTKCFLNSIIHLNTKCSICRAILPEIEPLLKKFHDDILDLNKTQIKLYDLETENRLLNNEIKEIKKQNKLFKNLSKNLTKHILDTITDEEDE